MLRNSVDRLLKTFEKKFDTLNRIEVSRSALLSNYDFFAGMTGQQIIPVLKSNAYGHGITQVATVLKDRSFPYLAVDSYFEALQVRTVSKQPVLILGMTKLENFANMHFDNFAFVAQDETTIRALGQTGHKVSVHIECNAGMNRYGIAPSEVESFVKLIQQYPHLKLEGIMAHLADADGADQKTVDDAVNLFDQCVAIARTAGATPTLLHVAQTAGSVRVRSKYANAVRLGLGLYGINPFPRGHENYEALGSSLRPALRLTSTLTKLQMIGQGEGVGYNYTFKSSTPMTIGVLPIGYYEGISEQSGNNGVVKVGDHYAAIAGKVCMNSMTIDLSGMDAKLDDEVIIYSNDPEDKNTIEALSAEFGLFRYGMLAHLSKDVRRILVD